jgi:hypothetical protein
MRQVAADRSVLGRNRRGVTPGGAFEASARLSPRESLACGSLIRCTTATYALGLPEPATAETT